MLRRARAIGEDRERVQCGTVIRRIRQTAHGTKSQPDVRASYNHDRTVCPATEKNRASDKASERAKANELAELISQRRRRRPRTSEV